MWSHNHVRSLTLTKLIPEMVTFYWHILQTRWSFIGCVDGKIENEHFQVLSIGIKNSSPGIFRMFAVQWTAANHVWKVKEESD